MKKIFKALLFVTFTVNSSLLNAASFTLIADETNQRTLDSSEFGIINEGVTLTVADNAVLINTGASNVEVVNNGTILSTLGTHKFGIMDAGTSANIITNNGIIVSSGNQNGGIKSLSSNSIITNNGTIITQNDSANAIYYTFPGSGSTVINNGIIVNEGLGSNGISATPGNTGSGLVINNGSITSKQGNSIGIVENGLSMTIINNGSIAMQGSSSQAIASFGDSALIINSGTVTSSDDGIDLDSAGSNDSALINTGIISAANKAIIAGSGDHTVTLGGGSKINGDIDLGGGVDTIIISSSESSGRLLVSNTENIIINPGAVGVVVGGNEIHIVDPTGFAAMSIGVSNLAKTLSVAINSKISDSQNSNENGQYWTKVFGSEFKKDSKGQNFAYDHDYDGAIIGYEYEKNFGLIVGLSSGEINTKAQSFKSNVKSVFIGGYKGLEIAESVFLNTNLIAGYEEYENKRNVNDNINGSGVASSTVDNLFFSPSIEIEKRIELHDIFEIRSNASMSYTYSSFDKTKEAGRTVSNINVEGRNVKIINSRVGVSGVVTLVKYLKIDLGTGFDSRKISESRIKANTSGSEFSFSSDNDKKVSGHYVTLGIRTEGFKDLTFGIELEKYQSGGNEERKSFNLSALYRF